MLAGQLVIIIALNWRRGKSATSATNEATTTARKDGVGERKGKEEEESWRLCRAGALNRSLNTS